jgi:hypothetical protein
MPREPVSGVDYNTHGDVQTCLNDIMNAVKGEEVRGSIHDAIALIDDRSVNLEQEIREEVSDIVEPIVEDVIDVTDLVYTIDNGTITCNKTYAEIMEILSGSKRLVFYVSPSFTSAVYLCIGTIVPAYSSVEYLDVKLYYIDYEYENVLHYCSITHFADRIRFNGDTATSIQAKLTAGANITIDPITNTISATGGGGGGSYSEGYGIDITNDTISADAVRCKLRVDTQGNVTSSISADILYALLNETDSIYEGHTVVFDVSIAGRGTFSNLQAEHNRTQQGGIRLHFHEVTKVANGDHVIYEFAVVLPASGYTGTCANSTMTIQPKLTAGTGISIQNGVISLDLPQAEGGGF